MSTLAFPLLRREVDQNEISTHKTQELPPPQPVAAVPGHNGEVAFRRHVIAVYNGYMAVTVLIGAFYVGVVWVYLQMQ